MLVGQQQESRLKPAGSTERLGYCKCSWSVAVTVVIVAATEAVRSKFTSWAPSEAGDDEVASIFSWMSSSGPEMRSTSIITGDAPSNIDVSAGLSLLADAGRIELSDFVIVREDPKKESILG